MERIKTDLPVCGGPGQINEIVDFLKEGDVPDLQNLVVVKNFDNLPEEIKRIYKSVIATKPIASGGMKVGIWLLPKTSHCFDAEDLILKIEGSEEAGTKTGCRAYWVKDYLIDNKFYPRIQYYCTGSHIEIFFNAVTDLVYSWGYLLGCLATPKQYYIENFRGIFPEKDFPYAILTLQQKVNGDVLMDLLKYQELVNGRFSFNSKINRVDYCFIVNYITQIIHTLYMLQKMFKFRHNDFWVRNTFIKYNPPGETELISAGIDLNSYDYYKFELPNNKNVYLRNTGLIMKISDFGHSRFETASVVFNNRSWIAGTQESIKRGFGWGNELHGAEYVDLLLQINGWIICIFQRFQADNERTRESLENWQDWKMDLKTGPLDEICEWVVSVLFLVLLFMYILVGPSEWADINPDYNSLLEIAKDATDIALKKRDEESNENLYLRLSEVISSLHVAKNKRSCDQIFSERYNAPLNSFSFFIRGDIVQKRNPLGIRIPKPLPYKFSMANILNFFIYKAVVGCNNQEIVSASISRSHTYFTFGSRKILNKHREDRDVMVKNFFNKIPKEIDPPKNLIMEEFEDIPYTEPLKSAFIGNSVEVYEFKADFSPLGLRSTEHKEKVLRAYGSGGFPEWVNYNSVKKSAQYINVVRIPKKSFPKLVMELYHYGAPKTQEEKESRPKKTLAQILGDVGFNNTGIVMSGDYFNYKNYSQDAEGRFYTDGQCTPPTCDRTVGIYKTAADGPVKEDEAPLPIYDDFYGIMCFKTTEDGVLEDLIILRYDEVTTLEKRFCAKILSGSPVLFQTTDQSREFFYPDQLRKYAEKHGESWDRVVQYFMTRNEVINEIMEPVPEDANPLIIGGQGLHFFSDNPRAAVGVDEKGDILLVTVEGRKNRGTGVDMIQLQKIMVSLGCATAINIDGGATSDILYKPAHSLPSIFVNTNPLHKFINVSEKGYYPGLFPSTALIFESK